MEPRQQEKGPGEGVPGGGASEPNVAVPACRVRTKRAAGWVLTAVGVGWGMRAV
ncbi:hypothetical protein L083_1997 [Actinoplanes sp. N902-109]|nr:hypothetical protein L083_1997 [Actinoplanes sp. N902-109]